MKLSRISMGVHASFTILERECLILPSHCCRWLKFLVTKHPLHPFFAVNFYDLFLLPHSIFVFVSCTIKFKQFLYMLYLVSLIATSLIDSMRAWQRIGLGMSSSISCYHWSISDRERLSFNYRKRQHLTEDDITCDSINGIFVLFIGLIIYKFMMPTSSSSMCVNLNTCLAMLHVGKLWCSRALPFISLLFCSPHPQRVPHTPSSVRSLLH